MGTREQRRSRAVPDIARLVRSRDFRTSFARISGGRRQVIVVVLPDDRMGYVFDQYNRQPQSALALAMATDTGCEIAIMWPASEARLAVAQEDDSVSQVHEDSTVGMFFDYLRCAGTVVVCRVAAQWIDHGDLLPT